MAETEEPLDAGDHEVPSDLLELFEVLEFQAAVREDRDGDSAS